MAAPLSTTSYSILGYLALRPFTAYELTKQIGRTFHHFWPRAESGIYREMKRLVDAGLAAADEESVGRRSRTRYTITRSGRAALRKWMAIPAVPGFLESEGLVRVLWADQGSTAQLAATIASMKAEAAELDDLMRATAQLYLAGRGEFQDRSHINVLIARFLVDFAEVVDSWSDWATDFVESWEDTTAGPPPAATEAQWREVFERCPDRGSG